MAQIKTFAEARISDHQHVAKGTYDRPEVLDTRHIHWKHLDNPFGPSDAIEIYEKKNKMTILDKIIAFKKKEIAKIKAEVPVKKLVESPSFKRTTFSLKKSLLEVGSTGIIAEYKRQSPSKGIINDTATIAEVTNGYLDANIAAQSILTDTSFFGGTMADLMEARIINQQKPILRKDFIVDGFQIVEAKAIGADIILLIASCLTSEELKNYGNLATDLGMEVLYEVHSQQDLDKINDLDNKIIGINNRNLKTFKVDLDNSIKLADQIPDTAVKISESGISDPRIIMGLKEYGFQGFLIGENFMKEENPGEACQNFINHIR